MLRVRLNDDRRDEEQSLEDIPYICLAGPLLKLAQHRTATYSEGRWSLDGRDFLVVDIDAWIRIQLGDGAQQQAMHGPFESARIVDGLVHVSRQKRQPFARLDVASGLWHIYSDGTAWRQMTFFAADPALIDADRNCSRPPP